MIIKKRFPFLLAIALLSANMELSQAQYGSPLPKDVETKMIGVLQSDASIKDKQDACRALAIGGTKDAVPSLAALLGDEKLSHMARYALEDIPDPSTKDALRAALDTAKGMPLVGVISSVGAKHDTTAIPTLGKLLGSNDADVSDAAAVALGRIGTSAAAQVLMASLAKPTPAIYDGLLRVAGSLPRKEATPIYDALRKAPAPQPIRMAALKSAILSRQEQGLPLLLEALRGADNAQALAASHAARELSGAAITKALATEAAEAKLPADRLILLVDVLGTRRDKTAAPQLLAVAQKSDGDLRIAAMKSLVQIGDASAIPFLTDLAISDNDDVAKAARSGLVSFTGRDVETSLLSMLKSPNPKVRLAATDLLLQRRATSGIPQLLVATSDTDPAVSAASIRVLGELGGNAEAPALVKIITGNGSPQAAQAAEGALSAIYTRNRDAALADSVAAALPNASPAAKVSLLRVLRRIGGPRALTEMRAAMNSTDKDVRDNATRNLYDWATPDALPDLMALAKNPTPSTNKVLALRGALRLIPLQNGTPEQKLATVKDALTLVERPEEKRLALTALGGIPTADALALVVQDLNNPDLKNEASLAAVTIGETLSKTQPAIVSDAMTQVVKATSDQQIGKRAQALMRAN